MCTEVQAEGRGAAALCSQHAERHSLHRGSEQVGVVMGKGRREGKEGVLLTGYQGLLGLRSLGCKQEADPEAKCHTLESIVHPIITLSAADILNSIFLCRLTLPPPPRREAINNFTTSGSHEVIISASAVSSEYV
ncbi:hypothetical protein EYF80_005128 [Liparis tanakae]|uniref:Uncharacterized protein n=1 Tax=Liparis tanakae TaxID=230148 RepID=A0A4Z2J5C4_9TELE|nr:hypothetical protein EYF80_005128 [Liparis tanakae]